MALIKYFFSRLAKVNYMLSEYVEEDLGPLRKLVIVADLAFSIVVYGAGITDYFQYRFYRRPHRKRREFMVYRQRMWLVRKLNHREKREIFDQKPLFNQTFSAYLRRQWLDMNSASYPEFCRFAKDNERFLVKPVRGSHGLGIRVEEVPVSSDLEDLYKKLQAEEVLLEELIVQHQELAAFNPSSVNTVRVVTLIDEEGQVQFMTANLRLGRGDFYADNFHHDGIAALLDTGSGQVISPAVDKKLKSYSLHPLSGKQISGFTVPCWAEVLALVRQAALVVPAVRYVGWDVAVGADSRPRLIEGNAAADPDLSQMPDQVGKWPLYRRVLKLDRNQISK